MFYLNDKKNVKTCQKPRQQNLCQTIIVGLSFKTLLKYNKEKESLNVLINLTLML